MPDDIEQQLHARGPQCRARRVHPVSTNAYMSCVQDAGHAGLHSADQTTWGDDHTWALVDTEGHRIDWRARVAAEYDRDRLRHEHGLQPQEADRG